VSISCRVTAKHHSTRLMLPMHAFDCASKVRSRCAHDDAQSSACWRAVACTSGRCRPHASFALLEESARGRASAMERTMTTSSQTAGSEDAIEHTQAANATWRRVRDPPCVRDRWSGTEAGWEKREQKGELPSRHCTRTSGAPVETILQG
jgi:hypothetical protein